MTADLEARKTTAQEFAGIVRDFQRMSVRSQMAMIQRLEQNLDERTRQAAGYDDDQLSAERRALTQVIALFKSIVESGSVDVVVGIVVFPPRPQA